ncbi:multidrug resistance-associated protein 1-like isoform X2 [Littorina saxatilis]|uniref:multidrug resistance-associated protein 1-like isoform X2 n=1 Tax=Littorina saxatilis TaxID=31220 RepID=UPI0038B45D6F
MRYLSSRETGREWQGYVLCVAMFLALLAKSQLFTHSMFHAARVGIRMKSTLIAAIYHKALSMSKRNTATVGEIVNLMSVDAQRVQDVMVVCFYAATSPLQIVVAVVLLYYTIGPSIFVGLLLLLCLVPINAYVITRNRQLQSSNLKFKDARIKLYSEVLNGIKVLKLYAWESSFRTRILETRLKEVAVLFKMAVLNTIMSLCWEMAPFLVTLVTFATYVLSDPNNKLDAGKAFVTLALFNVIRPPLAMLAKMIMYAILVQVSIKRLRHFLVSDDLNPDAVIREDWGRPAICVEDGTFTWNDDQSSPALHNINLTIGEGRLVAVVGPVGCGKSSLISAMLGEMEKVKGAVVFKGSIAYVPQQAWILNATVRDNILFGKPFSRTRYRRIVEKCELERDLTILSDGDMTEIGEKGMNLSGGQKQRVSVARAAYSDSDVYLLDDPLSAVDSHVGKAIFSSIIGPSGILRNKTRVLVTHGLHWLPMVDEVIVMHDGKISERGSYEELVSHDGPFAQFLKTYLTEVFEVEEAEDPDIAEIHGRMRVRLGSVTSCESSDDGALRARVRCLKGRQQTAARSGVEDSLTMSATSDTDIEGSRDGPGRLNTPEAVSKGKVDPSVFRYYASAVGLLPILLALLSFCVFQVLSVGSSYWLKEWSRHSSPPYLPTLLSYTNHTTVTSYVTASYYTTDSNYTMVDNDSNDSTSTANSSNASDLYIQQDKDNHDDRFYLAIYGVLGIGQVVFLFAFNMVHWTRMAVSARTLHARLADSMMHAPMAFFDTTPTGRVLNRVSYDVETVDTSLPLIIRDWLVTFALVLVTLAVIMIQTPLAGVVLLPTAVLYYFCQRFYVPTARQLRRIECVTRTPIYVLFSETISGAASIRAYDVTQRFLEESKSRVDQNQVYFFAYHAAIRWMQWNLDVLSAVIVLAASVFAIADTTNDSADAGLCISYALQLSGTLTWMTRQICDFETNIVSVERLKEYSEITPEADWTIPEKNPPAQWPERGEVTFNNYTTRYRSDLPLVLKGVTCTIRPGQKVGVVGRTGAGKSSLALSLFRLVEAAGGSIVIDGVNIADMGLHDLRARLTILPQEPVLFSGTLRMNLDPFDEYTDTQLWTALTRAHLHHVVAALPQHLHFQCGEEGGNLSMGQKQLVCLARTLLRRTKILVLDEATAAVDMETDALIQNTIRTAFSHSTVITIAHRLNTIMDYDKILVMSGGRIEEFAPPDVLLADRSSAFFGMAREAGLV